MLAIIGGTGLTSLEGLYLDNNPTAKPLQTPYGETSAPLLSGHFAGEPVIFLARHGTEHHLAPHCINYRANLWALKEQGVTAIYAVNAVGGISKGFVSRAIAIPDNIIDYTWGRESSYSEPGKVIHCDFSYPYTRSLRERLIAAAVALDIPVLPYGVYGATQGPRLETAAEIKRLARDGCDLVGMTGMPEAVLARELSIDYACIALVVNPAAGIGDGLITMADIDAAITDGMSNVRRILNQVLQ